MGAGTTRNSTSTSRALAVTGAPLVDHIVRERCPSPVRTANCMGLGCAIGSWHLTGRHDGYMTYNDERYRCVTLERRAGKQYCLITCNPTPSEWWRHYRVWTDEGIHRCPVGMTCKATGTSTSNPDGGVCTYNDSIRS